MRHEKKRNKSFLTKGVTPELLRLFDKKIKPQYENRSEAIRALMRWYITTPLILAVPLMRNGSTRNNHQPVASIAQGVPA